MLATGGKVTAVTLIMLGLATSVFVIQVGDVGSGRPTETPINQQLRLAAEATQDAASLQGCTQGAVEGAPPPALRDPDFPPDPAGQAFPPGQNARRRYRGGVADADADAGAVADADADAVADDYDRELQAALVASVTNQPGKWVIAPTHLTDMGPEEKPGETLLLYQQTVCRLVRVCD